MRKILSFYLFFILGWSAFALSIGTFNIEYFSIHNGRYSDEDIKYIANLISHSGAEIISLQEIDDIESIKALCRNLPGWRYIMNDTPATQDLAIIWDGRRISRISDASVFFQNELFTWHGSILKRGYIIKLFSRPPLSVDFIEKNTKIRFTLMDVHLKSMYIGDKSKLDDSLEYNILKKRAQFSKIQYILNSMNKKNIFIAGDFNEDIGNRTDLPFSIFGLKNGFSHDSTNSNTDFLCTYNFEYGLLNAVKRVREIESRIPEKSKDGWDHPDHDLIVIDIPGQYVEGNTAKKSGYIVKYLINMYKNGQKYDEFENPVLCLASAFGSFESVKKLIELGANVNAKTQQGYTPLMLATIINNKDIVTLLISHGANINMVSKNGETALSLAKKMGYTKLAEMIKK